MLTSMIEWLTQFHYVEHVRDQADLDELFRDILRFHWIDESRHARLDRPAHRRDRRASSRRGTGPRHRRSSSSWAGLSTACSRSRSSSTWKRVWHASYRADLHRRRAATRSTAAPAPCLPVDLPRVRARAPQLHPDRLRAHRHRPRQDRRRCQSLVDLTGCTSSAHWPTDSTISSHAIQSATPGGPTRPPVSSRATPPVSSFRCRGVRFVQRRRVARGRWSLRVWPRAWPPRTVRR